MITLSRRWIATFSTACAASVAVSLLAGPVVRDAISRHRQGEWQSEYMRIEAALPGYQAAVEGSSSRIADFMDTHPLNSGNCQGVPLDEPYDTCRHLTLGDVTVVDGHFSEVIHFMGRNFDNHQRHVSVIQGGQIVFKFMRPEQDDLAARLADDPFNKRLLDAADMREKTDRMMASGAFTDAPDLPERLAAFERQMLVIGRQPNLHLKE